MATVVLETDGRFPAGNTVEVYNATGLPNWQGRIGPPVATVVVAADLTTTIPGLSDDTEYVAVTTVNGKDVTERFRTPELRPFLAAELGQRVNPQTPGDAEVLVGLLDPETVNPGDFFKVDLTKPGGIGVGAIEVPDIPDLARRPFYAQQDFDVVGDGVANDSNAIQVAFNALDPGDLLIFEAGDYAASGLSIDNNGVRVMFMPGASLVNNGASTLLTVNGDDILIEGGTINGDLQGQAGVNWNGAAGKMVGVTLTANHRGLIFSDAGAELDAYRCEARGNTNVGFYCGLGVLRQHDCVAKNNEYGTIFDTASRGCRLSLTTSGNNTGAIVNNAGGYCDFFRSRDDNLFGLQVGDANAGAPSDWAFDYVEVRETGNTAAIPESTGVEMWGATRCSFGTIVGAKNPGYDVALTSNAGGVGCTYNSFGTILADGGAFDADPAVHLSGGSARNYFGAIYARRRTWAVSMNEGFGAAAQYNTFEQIVAVECDYGVLRCDGAVGNRFNSITAIDCTTIDVPGWPALLYFSGAFTTDNIVRNFEHRTVSAAAPNGIFIEEGGASGNNYFEPAEPEVTKVIQSYTDSGNTDFYSQGVWMVEVAFNGAVIGSALVSCAIWTDGSNKRKVSILASHSGWSAGAITFSVQNQDTITGVFRVATAVGSGGTVTVTYRRLQG